MRPPEATPHVHPNTDQILNSGPPQQEAIIFLTLIFGYSHLSAEVGLIHLLILNMELSQGVVTNCERHSCLSAAGCLAAIQLSR